MTSHGMGRRSTKQSSLDNSHPKIAPTLDVDYVENDNSQGSSQFPAVSPHGGATGAIAIASSSGSSAASNEGLNCNPIDVEAIEDEVEMLSPSRWVPRTRPRTEPVTVIIDDDNETYPELPEPTDEDASALLLLADVDTYCAIYADLLDIVESRCAMAQQSRILAAVEPPAPIVQEEPTFTCPICLNALDEPYSTICGHIFCQGCIKAAFNSQKKCPTCRRKLTKNNFHRVYLPTTN